jgi:hypothetical protein
MRTEFSFGGMRFGVTDGAIPEVDPCLGGSHPSNHVGVYVDHEPLIGGSESPRFERKAAFYLKPSEARTLASALMTAAQAAR